MSAEENKRALRRIPEELFNNGDMAVADEVVAADYIEHVPLPPGIPEGVEGLKVFVGAFRAVETANSPARRRCSQRAPDRLLVIMVEKCIFA